MTTDHPSSTQPARARERFALALQRRLLTRIASGAFAALACAHAHADCVALAPESTFSLPDTLNLPSNIDPAKSMRIGSWYSIAHNGREVAPQFSCTSKAPIKLRLQLAPLKADPNAELATRTTDTATGEPHLAFNYAAGSAALRAILEYRYRLNNQPWSAWHALENATGELPAIVPETDSTSLAVDARIAFVAGPGRVIGIWTSNNVITASVGSHGSTASTRFVAKPMHIGAMACRISSAMVDLGASGSLDTLTSVGIHTVPSTVNVELSDCPSGFGNVRVRFNAHATASDATNGSIALDSGSSASGFALHIERAENEPIALGQAYPLPPDTLGSGISYRIPLMAAWYRTGVPTAGHARANLEFTAVYP